MHISVIPIGLVFHYNKDPMTSIQEFRCEVCGTVTTNPNHWFVIRCGVLDLTVTKWSSEAAGSPGARHYCGEEHAQVYISRWFASVCSPPKPDFLRPSQGNLKQGTEPLTNRNSKRSRVLEI